MTRKFTAATRKVILELLSADSSRQHAAKVAGIDRITLYRWLKRGERVPEGRYGEFREAVLRAGAEPKLRALKTEQERRENDPDLAWKWLEKHEFSALPASVRDVLERK
jgi:hypothetical protein